MSFYTHNSFREMAEAIVARAERDGAAFPGIVPYDNPAEMACGYVLAVSRSKRTVEDQWCCPIWTVKDELPVIRDLWSKKLQALIFSP